MVRVRVTLNVSLTVTIIFKNENTKFFKITVTRIFEIRILNLLIAITKNIKKQLRNF